MFSRVLWAAGGVTAGLGAVYAMNALLGWQVPLCFANAGGIAAVLFRDYADVFMRRPARG